MNITFLIGNGFDLNLKMKTSYIDFYPYYVEKSKSTSKFIISRLNEEDELWSDLENALGKITAELQTDDVNSFLNEKEEMEMLLTEYLTEQENNIVISNEKKLSEEFCKKISNIKNELSAEDSDLYMRNQITVQEPIAYQFITFNYTDILDRIIDSVKKNRNDILFHTRGRTKYSDSVMSPLHIHSTLKEGIILGVNDVSQIANKILWENVDFTDAMVKLRINSILKEKRIEKAKNIIDKSNCILLFGLSLGDTDKFWWEYIGKWLAADTNNRLILFDHYSNSFSSATSKIRRIRAKKSNFIKRSGISVENDNNILDRVSVIFGSKIFSLDNVKTQIEDAYYKHVIANNKLEQYI